MNGKDTRKLRANRVLLTALASVMMLVFLAFACTVIFLNHMLNKINRVDPSLEHTLSSSEAENYMSTDPDYVTIDPDSTDTHIKAEEITFPTSAPRPPLGTNPSTIAPDPTQLPTSSTAEIYGDHLLNIMLVGQDRREGQSGRQRTDTMILVSINKSDNTITLTSFMRDMYVQIPGFKPNRLNAAYVFGGMNLLSQAMDLNFGVKIDGIVEVDFSGFEKIITILGGVNVTLTKSEAKYLNDLYDAGFLNSPVVVGDNLLNAEQALVYARLREIDSDYERTRRQRAVVMGLIEAYKDLPLDQMLGLLDEILPLITTDLTNAQIISYALDCFPMLSSGQIQTMRIPLEGTYTSGLVEIREGFCAWLQYDIDFEANKEALWEIFRRNS